MEDVFYDAVDVKSFCAKSLDVEPRFPVPTFCAAKKFISCSSALPTCAVSVDSCGCRDHRCAYMDAPCDEYDCFLSRPHIDFASLSSPFFLPSSGFVRGSAQACHPVSAVLPPVSSCSAAASPVSPPSPVRHPAAVPPASPVLLPHLFRPLLVPVIRVVWLVPVLMLSPFGFLLSFVPLLR